MTCFLEVIYNLSVMSVYLPKIYLAVSSCCEI